MKRLVKMVMHAFPAYPDPKDITLRELFNCCEFQTASPEEKQHYMLEAAEARYQHELAHPLHLYLGVPLERMRAMLANQRVMELGCFVGGTARALIELYGIGQMSGVDIEDVFIESARSYTRDKAGMYDFRKGFGERIPYDDETFDAVLTEDTLEHVNDVTAVVSDCYRVLKKGGRLMASFPSFYHPYGSHLTMVTTAPWLQLVFRESDIREAYQEIIDGRGEEAYWYRPGNPLEMKRQRFHGVNGLTASAFRRICRQKGFEIEHWAVKPLFSVGRKVEKNAAVGLLGMILTPLAYLPGLEEMLLHRVAAVLRKPTA